MKLYTIEVYEQGYWGYHIYDVETVERAIRLAAYAEAALLQDEDGEDLVIGDDEVAIESLINHFEDEING